MRSQKGSHWFANCATVRWRQNGTCCDKGNDKCVCTEGIAPVQMHEGSDRGTATDRNQSKCSITNDNEIYSMCVYNTLSYVKVMPIRLIAFGIISEILQKFNIIKCFETKE